MKAGRRDAENSTSEVYTRGQASRLQKRAGHHDKHLKLAKVIVFKACGPCNERPAPAALLHKPPARRPALLCSPPASRNLMFFNWEHGPPACRPCV